MNKKYFPKVSIIIVTVCFIVIYGSFQSKSISLKQINYSSKPLPSDSLKDKDYGEAFVLSSVKFYKNTDSLLSVSNETLDKLVDQLKKLKTLQIKLSCYTDNQGDSSVLTRLTKNRAIQIKKYFINKGIESHRIAAVGYGSQKPKVSNDTEEGRNKNNRVELRKKNIDDAYEKPLTIENVKFGSMGDTLFSSSYTALDVFAKSLKSRPSLIVKIIGNTSTIGGEDFTTQLSLQRANAVKNYLVTKHKIDPKRLEIEGMGDKFPMADDDSDKGRTLNNRIEVAFKKIIRK